VIGFVAAAGLFALLKIPAFQKYYITKFGTKAPQGPKGRRPVTKENHVSLEISQNPYHASMMRLAQLKAMQDTTVIKHMKNERTKKVFAPSQAKGESV